MNNKIDINGVSFLTGSNVTLVDNSKIGSVEKTGNSSTFVTTTGVETESSGALWVKKA